MNKKITQFLLVSASILCLTQQPAEAMFDGTPETVARQYKALQEVNKDNIPNIRQAASAITPESDVHAMTSTFARPFYPDIRRFACALSALPEGNLTLDSLQANLNGFVRNFMKEKQASIDATFTNIRTYWNNPVDAETGVNLQEVLFHVYAIARNDLTTMQSFCQTLADNTETQGGCHPGITGRLVLSYWGMVSARLYQLGF